MPTCAVKGCNSRTDRSKIKSISFFSLPKDPGYSNLWIQTCKIDVSVWKDVRVCSKHFSPEAYLESFHVQQSLGYSTKGRRALKVDAVPTEFLPTNAVEQMPRSPIQPQKCDPEEIPGEERMDIPDSSKTVVATEEENIDWKKKYLQKVAECNIILREKEKLKQENKNLTEVMNKYFTPGQIKVLLKKKKRVCWTSEDICAAISLRSVSPRAYRYLKNVRQFPLPGLSTLRKWASTLNVHPGILDDVFAIMKYKGLEFSPRERVAIISFDEMYVSNKICIDRTNEQVLGPCKAVQVMLARGLFASWKQIIYFDFDNSMSKDILLEAVRKLDIAGYTTVAVVSDMGGNNSNLHRQFNIGIEETQTHFVLHPTQENLKIYFFNDVPHIIKLVRNHLFDQGFKYGNKVVDRRCFNHLMQLQRSDFRLTPKLTQHHLDVVGTARQKVKTAAQCLSHTVSRAIRWCGQQGWMEDIDWMCASEIIQVINDWFDVFNTSCKFGSNMHAYGIDVEKQNGILNKMDTLVKEMRVGTHRGLIKFQKGILLNNQSLRYLYDDMKKIYGVDYLLTYRLNQDILENFFSYIRAMGASNDHPTPLEFRNRLRWYILGKHSSAVFSDNTNTEQTSEENLINLDTTTDCLSSVIGNISNEVPEIEEEIEEAVMLQVENFEFTNPDEMELLHQFEEEVEDIAVQTTISKVAQQYVAGYVAYRFRNTYSLHEEKDLNIVEACDWLDCLTKTRLLHPKEVLMDLAKEVEVFFSQLHGDSLSKEAFIFQKIINQTKTDLPKEVVACYVRTRTYIRLRQLNTAQNEKNKARYLSKKMQKVSNKKL